MSGPASQAAPTPAGTQPFRATIREDDPPHLAAALEEINNLTESAPELGDPVPSNELRETAERQLRRIHGVAPLLHGVNSNPDGEIDIHACPRTGHSIALSLFADGEVLCSVSTPDQKHIASFPTAEGLTDEALLEAGSLLMRAVGQGG